MHGFGFSVSLGRLVLLLLAARPHHVNGFPGGAPDSTCSTMLPSHSGATAQNTQPPYQITTSASTYEPGQNISVTISATGGNDFAGFLLTTTNRVGTFSVAPDGDTQTACSGAAVTHTNSAKKSSVTSTWTAPVSPGTGSVTFVATIVQSYSIFWTNIQSAAITGSSPGGGGGGANVPQPTTDTVSSPPVDDIDTSECGKTKACFSVPDGCTTNCDYILTWTNVDEAVNFEMSASVSSNNYYVAFALSYDQEMGDDSVIDCAFNDQTGTVVIQASTNVRHSNEVLSNPLLGLVPGSLSSSVNDGRITCRFQRLREVAQTTSERRRSARQTDSDLVFSLVATEYYILMAKGQALGGVMQYHEKNRVFSSSTVNMTAFSSVAAGDESAKLALIKAHGCLMLIAWMVFASFGILMPRYCKLTWPDETWLGKKIWFQIHQPCMIITLLLTAAAFVIIFVAVCGYSQLSPPMVAHPPLGITVMTLVIINPIMAIFRPEPSAEKRPVFNVFHFLIGLVAHFASVVTMFLGLCMPQLALPAWCIVVMVIYVCFHAAVEIILAIHMHADKCCPQASNTITGVEMKSYGLHTTESSSESTTPYSSKFKTSVIALHLCGVVACCAAIVVQIALS